MAPLSAHSASTSITPPKHSLLHLLLTPPQSISFTTFTMDGKSRDYHPVGDDDYPNESQPLTKPRYSDCSEIDLEDSLPPKDPSKSHPTAHSSKYITIAVLLALLCNIASGCFGFYYGKRDLDVVCAAYTTQYCEFLYSTLAFAESWI